jgi:chromosome segregation ATPase
MECSLKETIETLNHHIQDLQTDKIRLQNDLYQMMQRLECLQDDHVQQRHVNEQLEHERTLTLNSCQHFQQTNEQLIHDHDQLQTLYTKLEQEFDATIQQLTDQRTANRMLTKQHQYVQVEYNSIVKEKQTLINRVNYLLQEVHRLERQLTEQQPFDKKYFLVDKQYRHCQDELNTILKINDNLKQQLEQVTCESNKTQRDLTSIQKQLTHVNAEYANLITKYEVD